MAMVECGWQYVCLRFREASKERKTLSSHHNRCAGITGRCAGRSNAHGRWRFLALIALLFLVLPICEVAAQPSTDDVNGSADESESTDEQSNWAFVHVSQFDVQVTNEHPDIPSAQAILGQLKFSFVRTDQGYILPAADDKTPRVQVTLNDLQDSQIEFEAIRYIRDRIESLISAPYLSNVSVTIAEDQLDFSSMKDLREGDDQTLRIEVGAEVQDYKVSSFELSYKYEHPNLPSLEQVSAMTVRLARRGKVYIGLSGLVSQAEGELEPVTVPLSELELTDHVCSASAIYSINRQLVGYYNERGLIGVLVDPNAEDLAKATEEYTPLRLMIVVAKIGEIRTVAAGHRVPFDERINHPLHARILKNSPVQAPQQIVQEAVVDENGQVVEPETTVQTSPGDLIDRNKIDRYVFQLNRHPDRRVDAAMSASEVEGEVILDYLVAENRPWHILLQGTNTGTKETSEWRERIGIVHNQLTNHDDILHVDYVTAGFEDSQALLGSYEAPFFGWSRLRWSINGQWSDFTASDVGLSGGLFTGSNWAAGGQLKLNVLQIRDCFIDVFGGAQWKHVDVADETFAPVIIEGKGDFLIPTAGVSIEQHNDRSSLAGMVSVDWNLPDIAGTDPDEILKLGRQNVDEDWILLKWNWSCSFFLEPLLHPGSWKDIATPETSTLAHELAFSFRGQHALGNRLIPQEQSVIGGLYTVRGYEEAFTAGDNIYLASAEYRYHLPRAFQVQPEPGKFFGNDFRYAPQQVYGRPDWDLILRLFVDYGISQQSDIISTIEDDTTLLSTGAGVELQIKSNISVRMDWGCVIKEQELKNGDHADFGDNRFHFTFTLMF